MKAFCIAGTASGVGKTTISAGIMGLLKRKGYSVGPFKVGPDYIDPQFHRFITGNACCNLDSFFCDEQMLHYLLYRNGQDKDICVVEGVMGLYDGLGTGDTGSTASTVKALGIPVVLVVDAKASSRSIAAVIKGFCDFDRGLTIGGVILNRVSGERHFNLLKEIVESYTPVKCLGYMPAEKELQLKSRHLGLIPAGEVDNLGAQLEKVVDILEKSLDLEGLLAIARQAHDPAPPVFTGAGILKKKVKPFNLAYAFDDAFNFYYHDNLLLLEEAGIKLIPFSPLYDKKLPDQTNALYLGGGFPEEFGEKLAANHTMTSIIRERLEAGLPAYGECGGLMYLTRGIVNSQGDFFPMTGFFNTRCLMTRSLQRFGYARVEFDNCTVRAHEFHHSRLEEADAPDYRKTYRVTRASTGDSWECGLVKKNCLAAYAHVHFYANFDYFWKIVTLLKKDIQ